MGGSDLSHAINFTILVCITFLLWAFLWSGISIQMMVDKYIMSSIFVITSTTLGMYFNTIYAINKY
jgi:hypothetical protein